MDATPSGLLNYLLGLLVIAIIVALTVLIGSLYGRYKGEDSGTEAARLHFAAAVLTGLGLLFAVSMGMYYWGQQGSASKEIFDACKTIIPPIVTLILGYYFGSKGTEREVRSAASHEQPRGSVATSDLSQR